MEDPKTLPYRISALTGHDRERLKALGAWLLEREDDAVTVGSLANKCNAIESAHAALAFRLLVRSGVLQEIESGRNAKVMPSALIALIVDVGGLRTQASEELETDVELAWTLPEGLGGPKALTAQRSIADVIRSVISCAEERLWLVSPFMDEAGIEQLFTPAMSAIVHGVRLTVITHHLREIGSANSQAIERLRRGASALEGHLRAYSAREAFVDHRGVHPLLHAKMVVADGRRAYVGTANLTGHGLLTHLEVGFSLSGDYVRQIESLLQALIASELVEQVLSC